MAYVLLALIALAVWLFCLFDVLTADEETVRNLPKFGWFAIVLFTMLVGAVAWLVFGRPRWSRSARALGGLEQPAPGTARGPDDDPEFLRSLDRRLRGD